MSTNFCRLSPASFLPATKKSKKKNETRIEIHSDDKTESEEVKKLNIEIRAMQTKAETLGEAGKVDECKELLDAIQALEKKKNGNRYCHQHCCNGIGCCKAEVSGPEIASV